MRRAALNRFLLGISSKLRLIADHAALRKLDAIEEFVIVQIGCRSEEATTFISSSL